jgi:ubiquinone/menaquinone biosynthesis C-methylase UbiE
MMDSDLSRWDNLAPSYHRFIQSGDLLREQLVHPLLLKWLGNVEDAHLLDAGCGSGHFAHILVHAGAHVYALDGSEHLINLARETYVHERLRFDVYDLRERLSFDEHSFHSVVCALALMSFDPIGNTLHEFARVLKRDGNLFIIIPHPLFFSSGSLRKSLREKLTRALPHLAVSRYHTPYSRPWTIQGVGGPVMVYHRPLEYYVRALRDAGFVIADIEEPVLSEEFVNGKNNFLKLAAEIPPFLGIHASVK